MPDYDNPFKVFVEAPPSTWTNAEDYNLLRCMLLTWSWFFPSAPSTVAPNDVHVSYLMNKLRTSALDMHTDEHAMTLCDVESYHPYPPQQTTEAGKMAEAAKIGLMQAAVRAVYPHRRLAHYGITPNPEWFAVKNWFSVRGKPADPNYVSYRNNYQRWLADIRRIRYGGSPITRRNVGNLAWCDFLAPDLYLPNNTTFNGTNYKTHADCVFWTRYVTHCLDIVARTYTQPIYQQVQFHKPNTTTFLGVEWTLHQMNVLYEHYLKTGAPQGILIYYPSGSVLDDWRLAVRDWIAEKLL